MHKYHKEDRLYLQAEAFCSSGLVSHGFTSRLVGVSTGKITGLNLGFRVGDAPEAVMENYRLAARDLGFDLDRAVLAKQTHTDHIRLVTEADAGKGLIRESDIEDTDGLMTDCRGMALAVFSADCVPLLFLDPRRQVIAAVHAGWRGTVKGIGGKAVRMMREHYGCDPADILAAVGPSLGPCCFEFSAAEAGQFPRQYRTAAADGKVHVDLWAMNRDQLMENGITRKNIDISGVCTICRSDTFYSYRTHREHTGRQAAFIMLRGIAPVSQ